MGEIKMPLLRTKKDLAETILALSYGDLMGVAAALASMKDAEVRPTIETPVEYAALLFDWAESNEDD